MESLIYLGAWCIVAFQSIKAIVLTLLIVFNKDSDVAEYITERYNQSELLALIIALVAIIRLTPNF